MLLLAHASPESTVSNGLLSFLTLGRKMVAPVLVTAMGPLTAMIATLNRLPDVRPCWFCSDLLVGGTRFLLLGGREGQLRPFGGVSADVFSLLYFKMSSHSQFLLHWGGPAWLAWMSAVLLGPGDLLVFVPSPLPWASYHLSSLVCFSSLLPCASAGQE